MTIAFEEIVILKLNFGSFTINMILLRLLYALLFINPI